MRRCLLILKSTSLAFVGLMIAHGCTNSSADNQDYGDWDQLDVNFDATISGFEWSTNNQIGISATCSRDGATEVQMSSSNPAVFRPISAGEDVNLTNSGDNDRIIAHYGDHNYEFHAYFPYNSSNTDFGKLEFEIPSSYAYGEDVVSKMLFVASAKRTSIIEPVDLTFNPLFCILTLNIPNNIISKDGNTILKSLVLTPTTPENFSGHLAYSGTYNIYDKEVSINESSYSDRITIDFGENGYAMPIGFTTIQIIMPPFSIPEDGFDVVMTDVNGNIADHLILDDPANIGKEYEAGDNINVTISSYSIEGCASPVLWPIGYTDGVGAFAPGSHSEFHYGYYDPDIPCVIYANQTQAQLQFVVSDLNPSMTKVFIEKNNFPQYNYSAPCFKGLWTNDYFEFKVPVTNFPANTEVTLTMPAYSRGAPVFWNVEYLDGKDWKCDKTLQSSPNGDKEEECTWVIHHGNLDGSFEGQILTTKMTFTKPIRSGNMLIRVRIADGTYVSSILAGEPTTYMTINKPNGSNLFAFVNKSGKCKAISISW